MNRKQFFKFFGKYLSDVEIKHFDRVWDEMQKYQTAFKEDFPYKKDAPKEVGKMWGEMWRDAINIYHERKGDWNER